MQFDKVYLKEELQSLPDVHHKQCIQKFVEIGHYRVVEAAKKGKKQYIFTPDEFRDIMNVDFTVVKKVTVEEFAEGLKLKFPDSKVTLSTESEEVKPAIREIRSKITVDWS